MNLKKLIIDHKIAIGLIVIAFLAGTVMSSGGGKEAHESHSELVEAQTWTCSMHPNVQLPEPGQCPICFMDLIPLATDGDGLKPNQLALSEDAAKLADIQTVTVSYGKAEMDIHLSGKIVYDETRIGNITAWVPGRLERMFVDYTGITVKKGDHMMALYSPELYATQEELIQARKLVESSSSQSTLGRQTLQSTLQAAREKLRLMGLVDEQIREIESSDSPSNLITVYSPMAGVVIEKNGVEGAYVKTGTNIYTIADLSRVWVILDAYESDLPWLAFGQNISFTAEAVPGEIFRGRIAFINPVLDPKTRTVKVRINVSNPDGELKPGMFVHGTIHATISGEGKAINPELAGKWICPMHPEEIRDQAGNCSVCGMDMVKSESMGIVHTPGHRHESLLIPASAVLKTGERAIVYVRVQDEEPTFEGREIILGPRVGEQYIVKSGLNEGEHIVTKGNFKIDSAMQISAKRSMMNPSGGPSGTGHQHGQNLPMEQNQLMDSMKSSELFKKSIKQVTDVYFIAENSLADDEFKEAKKAMIGLNNVLSGIDPKSFKISDEAGKKWTDIQTALINETTHAEHWQSIGEIRNAFQKTSQLVLKLEKSFGHHSDQVFYEIYCPMAFDNAGASWLSKDKEVNNPYFGAKMLNCGEVKRTFRGG